MLKSSLMDGTGTSRAVKVTEENALLVATVPADPPPVGTPSKTRFFSGYLRLNGGTSASFQQNVNGSVTKQVYSYKSKAEFDVYINGIAILIADAQINPNDFGGVNPLTTGWDLYVRESGDTTYIINKAKTGGQLIAQAGFSSVFGSGIEVNELSNWTGNTDAQAVYIPINQWVPGGIRIGRGTEDKIEASVNDNLTGLNEFWVQLFGYKLYPGSSES